MLSVNGIKAEQTLQSICPHHLEMNMEFPGKDAEPLGPADSTSTSRPLETYLAELNIEQQHRALQHARITEDKDQVEEISCRVFAALNGRFSDIKVEGDLCPEFRFYHWLISGGPLDIFAFSESIAELDRKFPEWTICCAGMQTKIDERKGSARVHVLTTESGVPPGLLKSAMVQLDFIKSAGDSWKLQRFHSIPGMDAAPLLFGVVGNVDQKHPESTSWKGAPASMELIHSPNSINREDADELAITSQAESSTPTEQTCGNPLIDQKLLEVLDHRRKGKAPASMSSSSFLTLTGSLASEDGSGLNRSATTPGTSVYEPSVQLETKSCHNATPESRMRRNRSRDASPSEPVQRLSGSAEPMPYLPPTSTTHHPTQIPGQGALPAYSICESFQGWTDVLTIHNRVPQALKSDGTASQSDSSDSSMRSAHSNVRGLLRRHSFAANEVRVARVLKDLDRGVRASSCPGTSQGTNGLQLLARESSSLASSDSDDPDEDLSESVSSTPSDATDIGANHQQFLEEAVPRPTARMNLLLLPAHRLFATATASSSAQNMELQKMIFRKSRSKSLPNLDQTSLGSTSMERSQSGSSWPVASQIRNRCSGNTTGNSESQAQSLPCHNGNQGSSNPTEFGQTGRRRSIPETNQEEDSSDDSHRRKRYRQNPGASPIEDRFPCIFHAGEPTLYRDHRKKYKHISQLV